jgi:hypothetical protein
MPTRKNQRHRRELRQEEAEERAVKRAGRSAAEQLVVLDERLGENHGAKKERRRLKA